MKKESTKQQYKKLALRGYKKLAFGNTSDALKLMINDDVTNIPIDKMNFFNISEIKKTSNGSIEIKFFDRLKALQMIEELANQNSDDILPFYKALENSCQQLSKEEKEIEN